MLGPFRKPEGHTRETPVRQTAFESTAAWQVTISRSDRSFIDLTLASMQ
jgi:hypothetical protein